MSGEAVDGRPVLPSRGPQNILKMIGQLIREGSDGIVINDVLKRTVST